MNRGGGGVVRGWKMATIFLDIVVYKDVTYWLEMSLDQLSTGENFRSFPSIYFRPSVTQHIPRSFVFCCWTDIVIYFFVSKLS